MKKFLAILLALVMVFSFVACGGDENTDEGSDVQVKVGYIFIGPINDGGFTPARTLRKLRAQLSI